MKKITGFLLATFILVCALPGYAAGIFMKGSSNVSILVGSGRAFNENYTVVGGGIHYYVIDGLSVGLEAETWMGGTRSISKYSPQAQYVFMLENARPYLGAFFRRASIEGFPEDEDSVGYRAGLYFDTRSNVYLSAGIVYEKYQDCNETLFVNCSDTYPELTLSFAL